MPQKNRIERGEKIAADKSNGCTVNIQLVFSYASETGNGNSTATMCRSRRTYNFCCIFQPKPLNFHSQTHMSFYTVFVVVQFRFD